jgi:hypothetical protein
MLQGSCLYYDCYSVAQHPNVILANRFYLRSFSGLGCGLAVADTVRLRDNPTYR